MNDSPLAGIIESVVQNGLDTLDLHGLGLKELPPLPSELSSLRRLDLSGNRLRTVPEEVWRLTNLEELNLASNRIASLDAKIGTLHALRSLDLSENRLSTLPSELGACTSLERLSLFSNQIATLPSVVLDLPNLQWLDLARNRLDKLLDLHNLANLEVLDLSSNQLTSIDATTLPASLKKLFLDDNLLTEIPAPVLAIQHVFVHGNPIKVVVESDSASRRRWLRELVTGGYDKGVRYFEAPERRFNFAVRIGSKDSVADSLNIYFKAFEGTPVVLRLQDGSRVDLTRVGRQAALHIAEPSTSVQLEFSPTSDASWVDNTCEFAGRVLDRVPGAEVELIEKKSPTLAPELAPDPPDVEEAVRGLEESVAPLPAAVPTAARDTIGSGPSVANAEPVDAAVFCPPQVARNSVFLLQFFLYPPRAATEVDKQARQMDEAAERRGTYSLPLELPLGTRVDLHLEIPALKVAEPDAVLVWRGSITAAQFEVEVPADVAAAQVIGRVRIAVEGVPTGTLRFQLGVTPAGTLPGVTDAREIRARRYHRAFVSYSSKDRAEVLRRVQAFQTAGLSVFQDILSLDPGERWEKALYQEIDKCDVFLLFWSSAAAASEWVLKEIDYAIARKQGDDERPPYIEPVPIEGPPITPPPASLKDLHFNDSLLAQIKAADGEDSHNA